MIELRQVIRSPWDTPKLQMRLSVAVDASGALCPGPPGEWQDVPTVVFEPVTRPLRVAGLVGRLSP